MFSIFDGSSSFTGFFRQCQVHLLSRAPSCFDVSPATREKQYSQSLQGVSARSDERLSRQSWPSNMFVGFEQAPVVQDCIPTSLLKLSADNSTRAVKMFAGVQKYMAENGDAPVGAAKAELVQKLLHQV